MIKLFLDNVETSEKAFGKEYAEKLTDISHIFITEDDLEPFIGFIEAIEPPPADSANEDKSSKESGLESVHTNGENVPLGTQEDLGSLPVGTEFANN